MKFVDFFAGIGGIRLDLERAGHECVGFCEWDKFARQSYKAMYDTEGEWENHDIRTAQSYGIPKADLWTFGFPCQDLSIAGKRKGLQEGERSGLFYEIIRLLQGLRQEDKPRWLLAENVKGLFSAGGGFDFLRCIVELGQLGYSVEYQLLNSKDFGVPQNRERVFIVGCLGDGSGRKVFPLTRADGENPCPGEEQKPVRLGNIYGEQFGTGYAGNVWDKNHIAPALMTMQGGNREPMIIDAIYNNREPRVTDVAPTLRADRQGLCVANKIKVVGNYMPSGHSAGNVYDPSGLAPTVMENHNTVSAVAIADNGYDVYNKKMRTDGCTGTLTTRGNTSSNHCGTFGVLVKPVLTPDREEKRQNGRRIKENGEPMFTLTAQDRHGVAINTRIRKLTPRECWRLQGFPDEKFDKAVAAGVSNSQLYKQAGNAVSVPVAEAIGRRLREIELDGEG